MTKREAVEKWVSEMNAIPCGMIGAVWTHTGECEGDGWREVTVPRVGNVVWNNKTGESGEVICVYTDGEKEVDVRIDDSKVTTVWATDEVEIRRDLKLLMCGQMWSFGNQSDERWLRDEGGIQAMSDNGFQIHMHTEFGCFFGIDDTDCDFYEKYWTPLYEARGLQWHNESPAKKPSLKETLAKNAEKSREQFGEPTPSQNKDKGEIDL